MISISTTNANTSGNIVINEFKTSIVGDKTARVSRVATLDGGAYIGHYGVSDGDRTIRVDARLSTAKATILNSIYSNETLVNISMADGFYVGAIETMNINNGLLKMTILIKSKESS